MTILLLFASLYDGQEVFVWSNCLLGLGMDFLVGKWSLCEICSILRQQLISTACILLWRIHFPLIDGGCKVTVCMQKHEAVWNLCTQCEGQRVVGKG